MDAGYISLYAGWVGMLGGVISGALVGLFFHKDSWMGGYGSFRRRLTRLGHISFFGLGFINILFGLTAKVVPFPAVIAGIAAAGFITGAITMPMVCFLSAWKKPFRHLFPLPVTGVLVGLVAVLYGWSAS